MVGIAGSIGARDSTAQKGISQELSTVCAVSSCLLTDSLNPSETF